MEKCKHRFVQPLTDGTLFCEQCGETVSAEELGIKVTATKNYTKEDIENCYRCNENLKPMEMWHGDDIGVYCHKCFRKQQTETFPKGGGLGEPLFSDLRDWDGVENITSNGTITIGEDDPKKMAGDKKCPLQLISPYACEEEAWALKCGADKYGPWNWRYSDGIKLMTYVGALRRHLDAVIKGEDIDPESGRSHLAHLRAGTNVLLDAIAVGKLIDDRPGVKDADKS